MLSLLKLCGQQKYQETTVRQDKVNKLKPCETGQEIDCPVLKIILGTFSDDKEKIPGGKGQTHEQKTTEVTFLAIGKSNEGWDTAQQQSPCPVCEALGLIHSPMNYNKNTPLVET